MNTNPKRIKSRSCICTKERLFGKRSGKGYVSTCSKYQAKKRKKARFMRKTQVEKSCGRISIILLARKRARKKK